MHCLVLLLVVRVVKVVIAHLGELVVRVICHVDSYLIARTTFAIGFFVFHFSFFTFVRRTTFAIVPADLRSAGIEYKDLFNPITSYFVSR